MSIVCKEYSLARENLIFKKKHLRIDFQSLTNTFIFGNF